MPLTDTTIRNAKPEEKQYKLSDAKGMYLLVKPNSGKYWRLKYRFGGKEKMLALGVYPEVTLKEARDKCDQMRKLLRDGIDPAEAKQEAKRQAMLNAENSFEAVAREWVENQRSSWTERHTKYTIRRLETNLFPTLAHRPINNITAPELLSVIRKIESRDALDIAHRMLQTSGQIFRYAIATGRAERDIAADLRGALKTRKRENFARLEEKDLPEFFRRLAAYDGDVQTRLGLKLLLFTFVRTTELRAAKWEEFDFEKAEWRIPAERMKMREQHIVPLSKQAIEMLNELKLISGYREHLFPNRTKPRTFISENTLLYAMYRMASALLLQLF